MNMHCTFNFCLRPSRKESNVPLHKRSLEITVLIYILWSSATAVASCPAGAEKLSANNQVARLPYTLFHCICSYHHSTFWQKNQENLSDKQTFLSTYSVSQYNTSHWIIKNSKDIFYLFLFSFTSFCDKTKLLVFEKKVIFYWSRIDFLKVFFVLSFFTGVMHNSNTFDLYQKKKF